jgi:alpha-L-fucosidase 2
VAAVNDALVQCVGGKIKLLAALPPEWGSGAMKGIHTPGGHVIDMEWENGMLTFASLTIGYGGTATVCCNGNERQIQGAPGTVVDLT